MHVECAYRVALHAHKGQVDKCGTPYIEHPLQVMFFSIQEYGFDNDLCVLCLLHDVREDTDYRIPISGRPLNPWMTFNDYGGLTPVQDQALTAITRVKDKETYKEYIKRCALNPLAYKAKKLDLRHNMDPARHACLEAGESTGLMKRYEWSVKYLEDHPPVSS